MAEEHEPALPPDPEGTVDLWALGIPEPPADVEEVPVLDPAAQVWWLEGFDRLPTSRTGSSAAMPRPRCGVVEITCSRQL